MTIRIPYLVAHVGLLGTLCLGQQAAPATKPTTALGPLAVAAPAGNAALFVGVNEYTIEGRQGIRWLSFAADDAVSQAHLFAIELGLVQPEQTWIAISGEPAQADALKELRQAGAHVVGATKSEILHAIDRVTRVDQAVGHDPSDLVIVSLSAHGTLGADGGYYLIPSDGLTRHIPETCILQSALIGWLARSGAGKRVVLLDSCRDHQPDGAKGLPERMTAELWNALRSANGEAVLVSCAVGELSWEDATLKHGLFTHFLIESLRGGAKSDPDGMVHLHNVVDYLRDRVPPWANQYHNVAQTPVLDAGIGQGESIPLAADIAAQHLLPLIDLRGKAAGGDELAMVVLGLSLRQESPGRLRIEEIASSLKVPDDHREILARGIAIATDSTTKKDDAEAVGWFRRAAEKDYPAGMSQLGIALRDGLGVDADPVEAVNWFRRACQRNDVIAMTQLGFAYEVGLGGLDQSESDALMWFTNAAEAGDGEALVRLGGAYYYGQLSVRRDLVKAAGFYRRAASAGSAVGMANYGLACLNGWGDVAVDKPQAMSLFKRAAELGSGDAMINVGVAYEYGDRGLNRDLVAAAEWYRRASDAGTALGTAYLAGMYKAGRGVARDEHKAWELYNKAAEAGDGYAMKSVGVMLEYGEGGQAKDEAQAVAWYQRASDAGDSKGMAYLGIAFENGQGGVTKDGSKAVSLYRQSAQLGDDEGMYRLALAYINGTGELEPNDTKAKAIMLEAARAGNDKARVWMNQHGYAW